MADRRILGMLAVGFVAIAAMVALYAIGLTPRLPRHGALSHELRETIGATAIVLAGCIAAVLIAGASACGMGRED